MQFLFFDHFSILIHASNHLSISFSIFESLNEVKVYSVFNPFTYLGNPIMRSSNHIFSSFASFAPDEIAYFDI